MSENACTREYDFTLVLAGFSELTDKIEEALLQTCDDGTLAMRSGRPYITFTRSAGSLKEAILSAIADVRRAGVGADVFRVDHCNLVSQSDIARRIDKSRQMVHQYLTGERGPGTFPPPICDLTDDQPLWHWCDVARWLWENNMVKECVLRDAQEVEGINSVLEIEHQKRTQGDLIKEVMDAVCIPCSSG